jgi:hypothetical protein
MKRTAPFKKPAAFSRKDPWEKADIVAKFISSVVIAAIGIGITYQIQRTNTLTTTAIANAQIEAAKAKALDDRRTQESQITVQLLNHLISENGVQRRIALVALRRSVNIEVYDPIVQIIAKSDRDPDVRATAIDQLAFGRSSEISGTLTSIANDSKRPIQERQIAAKSAAQVTWRSGNAIPTNVFLASSANQMLPSRNPFSAVLAEALMAGSNVNDKATLAETIITKVAARSASGQTPVVFSSGISETELDRRLPGPGANALVVGISDYQLPFSNLPESIDDANRVAQALSTRGISVDKLINPTHKEFVNALRKLTKNGRGQPLVLYYSGNAGTSPEGAGWPMTDSTEAPHTWIMYDEIKKLMAESDASSNWLFIDAMYAESVFKVQK